MPGFKIPAPPADIAQQAREMDLIAKTAACCAHSYYDAFRVCLEMYQQLGFTKYAAREAAAWRLGTFWAGIVWSKPAVHPALDDLALKERIAEIMNTNLIRR